MVDYYQKYLKYKAKYLKLKNQIGSGRGRCKKCNCKGFRESYGNSNICSCKHNKNNHQ